MMINIFQKFNLSALFVMVCFAFSAGADAQSKKDQKRAKQLVEQGDKLFRQKDYRNALDQYSQAVVLVPNNGYAHFWKGYAHYYLKENDLALAELDLALMQKYKPAEVYKVRWFVNYEAKNYDAALEDINKLRELEPGYTDFMLALGDIYFGKGAYRDALVPYQNAVLKYPENGDLFLNLAKVQFNLGDTAGQGSAAENAIRKGAQSLGEAYYYLGDARQKERRFPEAMEAYQKSLTAKPEQYEVYRNLSELYRASSRIEEAIEVSKRGLRLFPNDGNIYTDLSWFYSLSDRHEDAVQAALAGIRFAPTQPMAYTNLCRAYNDSKKPELAITACNNALKLSPNDGETNFYLGRSNALLGREAKASEFYKKSIVGLTAFTASNPDYSDGFYLLGNAYFEDGQHAKAAVAYKRSLELNPRFVKARFNMGIISVILKNKPVAMEQYDSLLSLNKNLADKLKAEIDKL